MAWRPGAPIERKTRNFATPEATTPAGAVSAPCRRSVTERPFVVDGARTLDVGGRRSMPRAAETAAPASRIPQPRSAVQPVPVGRRAVSLSRRTMRAAGRSGLRWRISAAAAATWGAAIDVPWR